MLGSAASAMRAVGRSQAVITFRPDGTIIDANAQFCRTMGYARSELRGRPHAMFLADGEQASDGYLAFWAALRAGEVQSAEFCRVAKGGRTVWLRATYTPVLGIGGGVRRIVKLAVDITQEKLRSADDRGQLVALDRAQAVIAFGLDGTILMANDNFLATVGYRREEVVGQHHRLFVDPLEARGAEYARFWDRLRAGEFVRAEFRRLAKGGREVWLQASYNPILGADGRPMKVVKFATDVTADKQRAADHQGKIEAISRAQAIVEFDLEGIILDANPRFLDLMGYGIEELRGKPHRTFVAQAVAASPEYAALWAALRRGESKAAEFERVAKNGRPVWLQASYNPILDPAGKPMKVVKFATDITQDVAQRERLRLLSLVADETDNSVVITDAEGLIEFVNPGFTRMTGYSSAEVRGRKPGAVLQGPGTSEPTRQRIRAAIAARKPFLEEILNYTKQGMPDWISLSINPVLHDSGALHRFISIQANVTATKQASLE